MPVIDGSCDRRGKLPKADRAGLGRVGTAGRAMAGRVVGQARGARGAILQDRRRKGTIAGPTKARMRFGGMKIVRRIRKPWEGKRPAGGRISVGLVRRRNYARAERGIGRAVGEDCRAGRQKG
ncbi:hypothetical protein BY996DRAFT_6588466 [Phakopsora pachyrhizi]|nr:hypothetical protein BY996DRAFT_6588466 [Phakopsora pachyrhizi]